MNFKTLVLAALVLFFTACGSNSNTKHGETTPAPENADFSDTFVYDSSSQYKSVLIECAGAKTEDGSCTLEKLPFLAQEKAVPTKEMIMQRVVVSHKWMGERFATMLDLLEDDVKILLGAVTAIVIDDDIIPSYYWGLTGAMYIDPRYLWLTPEEAATIVKKEDFRSGFSSGLQFLTYGLGRVDGKVASEYFPLDENLTRTTEDITLDLAAVLYHELAHANDFFPAYLRAEVDKSDSVLEALDSIFSKNITNKLYETYPLTGEELAKIGAVMYAGKQGNEEQNNTTATDMGTLFMADNAVMMYAYSTPFEDTATLFENAMMKIHYNVEADFAFLEKPTKTENLVCADYIVGWGVRNRIANEDVKRRSLFITKKILPNMQGIESIFSNDLGNATLLATQVDWCTSTQKSQDTKQQFKMTNEKMNPNGFKIGAM